MANGFRVYGSRLVDQIKYAGKPSACAKSQLVVQAYKDHDDGHLTHAPTVQSASKRLLLTIFEMESDLSFFTRDISQAYVQSETKTQRSFFVRPLPFLNEPQSILLRVERPFYSIPEAGLH